MYTEVLPIDLRSVVRVAVADNINILQARARVEAAEGAVEAAWGSALPFVNIGAALLSQKGSARAVQGAIVPVDFTAVQPAAMIGYILNPGRAVFEILASRKRLRGIEYEEQSTTIEALRASTKLYYELLLAQARIEVANEGVSEAEELVRVAQLRLRSGVGVPADELRARAQLANRHHDLDVSIHAFYSTSIDLATTLRLDSTITLVPRAEQVVPVRLVSSNASIDRLLMLSIASRPDLAAIREFAESLGDEKGAALLGAVVPQVGSTFQSSEVGSHVPNDNFAFHNQEQFTASIGWNLNLSILGFLKTAGARERIEILEAMKRLDEVKSSVIKAVQSGGLNTKLMASASEEVESAIEALRVARLNMNSGTNSLLDVLQAQDAAARARGRYAEAVVHYNESQIDLLASMGLLNQSRFDEQPN